MEPRFDDPHPCKNCITFVMCQARIQEHIRNSTLTRAHEYDYCDYTGDQSCHRDTVMLAFYMELAHCDFIQAYIHNRIAHRNKFRPSKYQEMRESVTMDILYEVFNISLPQILDFNRGLNNGITMP